MHELMNFNFKGNAVTVITDENGEPWWVGPEVCRLLEYRETDKAIKRHCKYLKLLKPDVSSGLGLAPRGVYIIPESDLFRLIIKSKMPDADSFERWVFEDVLPTIRKTGSYNALPMSGKELLARAVLEADKTIKTLEHKVDLQKFVLKKAFPVIKEHQQLMDSTYTINLSHLAKRYDKAHRNTIEMIGAHNGIKNLGIGPKKLIAYLRLKKILMNDGINTPYQKYINNGWFEVRTLPDGKQQTRVTTKGLTEIIKKISPIDVIRAWHQGQVINNIVSAA